MFKRRRQPGFFARMLRDLWPSTGWVRRGRYLWYRLVRDRNSPHSIALGCACGVAVSFTPWLGAHLIFAWLVCWLLGGSYLAAVVGTLAGNPLTFPLIWAWVYLLGCWLVGQPPTMFEVHLSWSLLYHEWQAVLIPMAVGGHAMLLPAWIASYWPVKIMVRQYQALRAKHQPATSANAENNQPGTEP